MVISSSYFNFLTIIVTDLSLNLTEGYLQNNKIVSHILIYQVYYIKESMVIFLHILSGSGICICFSILILTYVIIIELELEFFPS